MADADRPSYAYVALSFVIVAIVWGGTNPLLKRGSEAADTKVAGTGILATLRQLAATLANWRFTIPFLVNQSGSFLYFFLLGSTEISMAVPICNSLTFIFTAIAAKLLGEEQRITPKVVLGTALIAVGVSICVYEKM